MPGGADFRIPRDRVAGQPDDETAWLVIEDIYDALDAQRKADPRLDELTAGQRALYVLHWVQSEIRNGGFDQLYYNSTGRLAWRAPEEAELIGAADYAAVFRRANQLFPDGEVPEQQKARRELLREVRANHRDALSALEDEFFELLLKGTDIYVLMGRYVHEHPGDFFTD